MDPDVDAEEIEVEEGTGDEGGNEGETGFSLPLETRCTTLGIIYPGSVMSGRSKTSV